MSATIFSGIINGDGHGAPVTGLFRAESYGKPATLRLSAWCGRGYNEPQNPARVLLESSTDGTSWSTLVNFGDVREDVVDAEVDWAVTSELRVAYEFAPDSTAYWWPIVRLN